MGVAGRAQEGGDTCIVMTELSCCVAETNTTCKAIILQLKKKVKKKKEKKNSSRLYPRARMPQLHH